MKRTPTVQKLALVLALFLLAACGKKDDASPKAQTSLLTASPWKNAKNEWETKDGRWVAPPSYAGFPYYPGQTVTYFDGGAYSVSPGGAAGTWLLSADSKTLTLFTSSGGSETLTVSSLTSSTLQFYDTNNSKDYTIENQGTPTAAYTYYDAERTTLTH